jgi:hypothetical protein
MSSSGWTANLLTVFCLVTRRQRPPSCLTFGRTSAINMAAMSHGTRHWARLLSQFWCYNMHVYCYNRFAPTHDLPSFTEGGGTCLIFIGGSYPFLPGSTSFTHSLVFSGGTSNKTSDLRWADSFQRPLEFGNKPSRIRHSPADFLFRAAFLPFASVAAIFVTKIWETSSPTGLRNGTKQSPMNTSEMEHLLHNKPAHPRVSAIGLNNHPWTPLKWNFFYITNQLTHGFQQWD